MSTLQIGLGTGRTASLSGSGAGTESDPFILNALGGDLAAGEYEAVAASATAQVLGGIGDYLDTVWVQPATTSPGNVIILDGNTTIFTFPGGANSVSNLVPFPISLGIKSVSGAFKITTGSNVSVLASGNFTT